MIGLQFTRAVNDIADQVGASMSGPRANLDPDETVYVYALVVPDDFGSVMGYANTIRHLATTADRPLDKWYFAQWLTGGMDLRTEVLTEALGDAGFQDDRELQYHRQAAWLVALAKGLQEAQSRGGLAWCGRPVAALCSMIDSEDAVWIERETARLANPPDLLATFEAELAAAAESWYGTTDPGSRPLRSAFARVLEAR
jgi:hypothetical protein